MTYLFYADSNITAKFVLDSGHDVRNIFGIDLDRFDFGHKPLLIRASQNDTHAIEQRRGAGFASFRLVENDANVVFSQSAIGSVNRIFLSAIFGIMLPSVVNDAMSASVLF